MNFAWAMDMVLNKERAVRRETWNKDDYILKDSNVYIKYHLWWSSQNEAWYPEQKDMLAEDWVEVLEV